PVQMSDKRDPENPSGSSPLTSDGAETLEADGPPRAEGLLASRGIRLRSRSIRQYAARGVIVTSAFSIAVAAVTLVRGLLIGRFLSRTDYGIWGILTASLATLWWLREAGV